MNESYLFLLPEGLAEGDEQWPVLVRTVQGQVYRAQLGHLPPELGGAKVAVVLPMEMAGYCEIGPLPGRRPSRESLAYAAEEQLAAPLETLHLAFGLADEQGCRKVMAVDLERLQQVMARLLAQGCDPVAVYVDADLLCAGRACALWFEGRWLLGGTEAARLAINPQSAQVLMPRCPSMPWMAEPGSTGAALCDQEVASAVETLVQGTAGAVDLRQGALRRRRNGPRWQGPASAVVLASLMLCLADYLRAEWLMQRVSQQYAENVQVLQRWASEQPASADLAIQISLLEHRPRPSTAVEQLALFAEQLVGAGNLTIERAESSPAQGWRVEVVAQSFDDLERLSARDATLQVEHARQADAGVRASISWRGAQ
jgi:general secretion pathway protein L